ncbi:MAG: hypothetical protein N2516_04645, partial [Dictyoglomaceae bacterium]|nr:hypothetical protein [Dictyoglomaceae bacterium]
ECIKICHGVFCKSYGQKIKNNDRGKNSLKITLFRCIGYLSRGDLKTRKEFAGPYIPTPNAQCLGKYNFEYSFVLLNSNSI